VSTAAPGGPGPHLAAATSAPEVVTDSELRGHRSRSPGTGRSRRAVAVALVAGAVAATLTWVVEPVRVSSDSMVPTLPPGDHVLLLKQPWAGAVERGQIVVLDGTEWAQEVAAQTLAGSVDPPSRDRIDAAVQAVRGSSLVKRVVGVGGDTVALEDGALVVNGAFVPEPFVDLESVDGVWFGPVTVPPDAVFVMGDARSSSVDSRVLGPARLDAIEGRVLSR